MKSIDLTYIVNVFEFAAALVATVYFKKYAHSSEKYFLFFLWLTFIVEVVGGVATYFSEPIEWLYKIYNFIAFLFYFFWYYTILVIKHLRKTVVFFAGVFISMTFLAYLYPDVWGNRAYAFIIGSISLLILTLFHFYQLLNSNEVLIVKYKLSFWISTGLLLFYLGIIPLILLSRYLDTGGLSKTIILLSLNLILYGSYIIGFIWTKKKYNHF